jgi:23S rRNA pseudouridine1911/1915/1917 synthase
VNGSTEQIDISLQVPADQAGQRLDQAAVALFPGYSRGRLQSWIRDGSLTLNGQPAKPKQRLAGGEVLQLNAIPDSDDSVQAQNIPLLLVASDEHFLVLNKPAGLVVHPAAGHPDGTLQNGLLFHDPALAAVPRSGIVHRLDKDTSGILVVARNLKAHAHLVSQLQDRSMSRTYEAVVHGITAPSGTIDAPIGRNPHNRQKMAVVAGGRPAISHYTRLASFRHFSHLRVALESGRTHQIRVHMQHLGHPLVGDPQYGRKTPGDASLADEVRLAVSAFPRQALHARTLKFDHPATGKRLEFSVPLPDDLQRLIGTLERADR